MKGEPFTRKPWIDAKGQRLDDSLLKVACRNWSSQDWEEYLSTLETNSGENILERGEDIENLSQEKYEEALLAVSEELDEKQFPHLKRVFIQIMKQIPERQRKVLHYLFWEGLSVSATARRMGVSRPAIQQTRDRALKRVTEKLLQISGQHQQKNTVRKEQSHQNEKVQELTTL